MKSRVFLVSLLAGAISTCVLAAAGQSRPAESEDLKKARLLAEEKMERFVAGLRGHCQKMLDLQIEIHDGTKGLHKVIEGTAGKKPRPRDKQALLKLSENEKDSLVEATKALELLNADGSAVAFTEVFQELRKDMKRVQCRLENGDVGLETQALEKDLIDTLKEMIAALEKG